MSDQSPTPVPERILVRGVNWLGDAVMATPALQRLRDHLSHARLTLLTPQKLAGLWLHHPCLDATISFAPGESPWSIARRLRGENFDTALVLPNSPRSALEVWLAGIPHRVGYARPWRNWFLTRPVPPRPGRIAMLKLSTREVHRRLKLPPADPQPAAPDLQRAHHIHDYLHLAGALGANPEPLAPKLEVLASEIRDAEAAWLLPLRRQSAAGASDAAPVFLGLNPSAAYGQAKRWPAENFAAVAREVSRRLGNCVWFALGEASDAGLCGEIVRLGGPSVVNLAGQTTLRQLMALLKLCRLLLTNDTGPMHIAAALGTPVVVPFGSTSPELTGPGLPGDSNHQLLTAEAPCRPCFRRACPIDFRCMTRITVERVVHAVIRVLATT